MSVWVQSVDVFVCLNCFPAAHEGDGGHVEGLPVRGTPPLGGQPGE